MCMALSTSACMSLYLHQAIQSYVREYTSRSIQFSCALYCTSFKSCETRRFRGRLKSFIEFESRCFRVVFYLKTSRNLFGSEKE